MSQGAWDWEAAAASSQQFKKILKEKIEFIPSSKMRCPRCFSTNYSLG